MEAAVFQEAIDGIATSKGLTHDQVISALKEAIQKAYVRYLGSMDKGELPEPEVVVELDEENGTVTIAQILEVRNDDDIEDDFLQISPEDAKDDADETIGYLNDAYKLTKPKEVTLRKDIKDLLEKVKAAKKAIKVGGTYAKYCPLEEISKFTAMAIKSNFRSRINEAERTALYEIYKDSIGEIVTGTVERLDDRSMSVNIGHTVVELTRKQMVGDEVFRVGQTIKVYIQEVKEANPTDAKEKKGPQIEVTRASEGFLKRLFEEEVHEIYDGSVIIKAIAREAGVRSKVAVYSNNEDIDATGACIGPGGQRIQRVVSEFGQGSNKDKEKIDIIAYNQYEPLYIADSLRPAQVLGVAIKEVDPEQTEENNKKRAVAVVKDEQYSLAIGKKGANARLANRLTGYDIEILSESVALERGIQYDDYATLESKAEEFKKEKESAAMRAELEARRLDLERRKAEALKANEKSAILEKKEEPKPVEQPIEKPVEEEAPVKEEKKVEPVKEVKITTSLEDLEKGLAEEKAKDSSKSEKKGAKGGKAKRPRNISEAEVKHPEPKKDEDKPVIKGMNIYTEEELEALENEEDDYLEDTYSDEELEHYEDYDEYYDDEK